MMKRMTLALALAVALVVGPAVSAQASAPRAFANCTQMHKVYKGGVAKSGVRFNIVSGKKKPFHYKPKISTPLYNANKKLDRDKDGIACEA